VTTIACSNVSSVESVTIRWSLRQCQGDVSVVTVYPPNNPCGGSFENAGTPLELNQATYQVCNSANTNVCPVVQLFFASQGAPQAPPTDPSTLGCSDVTIASTSTNAPVGKP
jgi:hypothetical protein